MRRGAYSLHAAYLLITLTHDLSVPKKDRSAAFKDQWECFLQDCQDNYMPGNQVTVDEQLLGFRGKCYLLSAKIDLGSVRIPKIPAGKVGEYYTLLDTELYLDCGRTVITDN